jgi:hypothetical protein
MRHTINDNLQSHYVTNNKQSVTETNISKLITDLDDSAQEANQRLQDFTNSTTINVTPNLASTLDTRKCPYSMAAKTQTAVTPMQSKTMPPVLLHGNRRNSNSSDSA